MLGRVYALRWEIDWVRISDVGGVAQLGERRVRNAEVVSSILILSTISLYKQGHEKRPKTCRTQRVFGFLLCRARRRIPVMSPSAYDLPIVLLPGR